MTQRTPDPHAMTGYYETSETGGNGARQAQLTGVSPVFDRQRAADLAYAVRAMDPDDEDVPASHVSTSAALTINRSDPEADRRRITAAAGRAHEALQAAGLDVDPVSGAVTTRDETAPWVNHARSMGPMVQVDEKTDRSAG
jgi:hypothetical protein